MRLLFISTSLLAMVTFADGTIAQDSFKSNFEVAREGSTRPARPEQPARLAQSVHRQKIVLKRLRERDSDDTVDTLFCKNDRVAVTISNKFGIGGVRLIFDSKYKPSLLELQFKRFSNLESLSFACGNRKIQTSLSTAPLAREFRLPPRPTETTAKQHIDEPSKLRIEMKRIMDANEKDDQIIAVIPCKTILGNNCELEVEWIDWYR